jgi:hypothetical protein
VRRPSIGLPRPPRACRRSSEENARQCWRR